MNFKMLNEQTNKFVCNYLIVIESNYLFSDMLLFTNFVLWTFLLNETVPTK